jgi:Zn-dependent peptidase ImmA (M78 family)
LKRAWVEGPQDLRKLARRFDVSVQAMQVRLLQVGLIEPSPRCEMAA